MEDMGDIEGGSVGSIKSRTVVQVGFVMMVLAASMFLLIAIDDYPDFDDYDSSEEYNDAVESYNDRTEFYPACMILLLFGGVIVVCGGLVQSGLEESYAHPYIRIAVIVSGVLLLIAFLEFILGPMFGVLDSF